MSAGELFKVAAGYWYIFVPLLALAVCVGAFIWYRRWHRRQPKANGREIDAIVFAGRTRSDRVVALSDIEGGEYIDVRILDGKPIVLLEEPCPVANTLNERQN